MPDEETPPPGSESRRGFERFSAILEVRVKTQAALQKMYTRDISQGGLFIATTLEIPIGSEVLLDVIHPETEHVMHLMGIVVRKARKGKYEGVAVELLDLDEQRREAFLRFVQKTEHDED